jgi:toxin-antitoxin system PIN domain toxin
VKLLDANLVISAARPDHPHHSLARQWFDRLVEARERFTVPDVVWAAYVRVVTNGRVFPRPSTPSAAFAHLRQVQDHPLYVTVVPGARHLDHFERLCTDFHVVGSTVTDAYLAAIAIEHGCTLVSLDGDFGRFAGLDWERPG